MAKRLLFSVTTKDCKLDTFTVHGPGGGGKDTSNTGVRWTHLTSGAVGEAREERSQQANKIKAWGRMARHPKFQTWLRVECAKKAGQPSIDDLVDQAMHASNIRIEVKNAKGQWEVGEGNDDIS